jgi:isochorismate synthase EntC
MNPMEFVEFLTQWGGEILLALAAAGITAYLKNESNNLKKKLQFYEDAKKVEEQQKTEHIIEEKLEPIYEELEALRTYIRETESIEKVHMSLIIASYRFRLIQLCKEFIKQGYLT